ncbi:MAG: hypothetical protein ACXVJD_17755, partial [Mucilaginibacter sp.]
KAPLQKHKTRAVTKRMFKRRVLILSLFDFSPFAISMRVNIRFLTLNQIVMATTPAKAECW